MSRIEDAFSQIADQLGSALEEQRLLHLSAFGKSAQERMAIISHADNHREKLEFWMGKLLELKDEMTASGLFNVDIKTVPSLKPVSTQRTKRVISSRVTKPVSVTVLGQHKAIRYWKDIPLFVAKVLYEKDPLRFLQIENESAFQGRKSPYISIDKQRVRKPEKIEGSPYYIGINLNQEYCRKLSNQLMSFFGCSPSDLEIEVQDNHTTATSEESRTNDLAESTLKIGQRAHMAFAKLLTNDLLTVEDIQRLCRHDYSKKTFGATLPVLRQIQPGNDTDEMRLDRYGKPRYYKEAYISNGNMYIIYSQWFKRQIPRLEAYLSRFGV